MILTERLDLGKRWEKWLARFERELVYNGVNSGTHPDMASMALLIYAGPEVEDIHDSLPNPVKPEELAEAAWTTYAQSLRKLNLYFVPQKSKTISLYLN